MQGHLGCQLMLALVCQVRVFHGTFHILSDIQWRTRQMAIPPVNQLVIVGSLITNLPIQLGHAVVHPAIGIPKKNVGIQLVIILQTIGLATVGIAFLITINAKGRNAELHPRLGGMDGFVNLLNKHVNIIATPIITILHTIGRRTILRFIWNFDTCDRIGIEIVIDMQAIDIVAFYDILDNIADIVATLLISWIK